MNNTPCGCKLKCFEQVGDKQCKLFFDNFWKLANFDVQNAYLVGSVKITEVHRRYSTRGGESSSTHSCIFMEFLTAGCLVP